MKSMKDVERLKLLQKKSIGENLPPALAPQEQARIMQQAFVELDSNARNLLIERNLRLVFYIARKFESTRVDIEELFSIGTIGLIKAVNTFSLNADVKLPTYASRCIENEILMFLRSQKKYKDDTYLEDILSTDVDGNELRLQDILPDPTAEDKFSLYENRSFFSDILTVALNNLSCKEQVVLFYMLAEKNQQDIGELLSISQSYVSRLELGIQKKMRSYTNFNRDFHKNIIFSIKDCSCYLYFLKVAFRNFDERFSNVLVNKFTTSLLKEENSEYIFIKLSGDCFAFIAQLLFELYF